MQQQPSQPTAAKSSSSSPPSPVNHNNATASTPLHNHSTTDKQSITSNNTTTTTITTNRRRGQSTHHSPSNLLIPLLGGSSSGVDSPVSPSASDRRRSVSDGILSSYASSSTVPLLSNIVGSSNSTTTNIHPSLHHPSPSNNVNLINNNNLNVQQQPSSSTSPLDAAIADNAPNQSPNGAKDEWLVVPILIVSSLPKEVDQILRYYTTGKQLKKQSPPCCNNEKQSSRQHHKDIDPTITTTTDTEQQVDIVISATDSSLDDLSPNDKKDSTDDNSDSGDGDDDDEHLNPKDLHGPNHQRQKHHRSSKQHHHHHKPNSVSFQVPVNSMTDSRRKASEDSSQGNIQNIQQHIHQQLVLHENQEVKIFADAAAAPPTHKQTTSTKKASSSNLSKSAEKSPNKLNYYLRKNKRVTEWYIEEVCSLDYLSHVDEFLEKNEVNQISSLANDLLNTGINLEDLISIDEEEFFESVLEKQSHVSTNERRKIMFRVCHTGSRHALSLRQALYKQMILEPSTDGNQIIAPTTVIFAYSYTNSNYSLENTAMTWMKEINQIYPDFLSQGNFLLAGHIELNKSTKQQVALLRRGVEDSSANVGLVQKPKHYYHFHQKAVPLFQMKKNQRLTIVEFDTRLGTNIQQLFFESYRLYCLNHYRKKLSQALRPKPPQVQPITVSLTSSILPGHEQSEPQVTSPTLNNIPNQTMDPNKQLEEPKKKKETQGDPNEIAQATEEEEPLPKVSSPSGTNLASHKQESKPEKTALPLGILKIFKKSKKEESLPSSKKPPVEKILKNLKKKKKKEDEIFRWHKIADNLIMSEKPKKKNKKDKQVVLKTDTISATDDSRDVLTDTFFHNRKNMALFPYSLHLMDQNDTFSPQFEKNNSNILSKPIEDDENPYLEDPTENDLMGEASESSSVPDTFEHNFTAVTNTNSSYPGEVIASDNEEADLDTENDIGSEVDDFTFQSSIGSATPQVLNAAIFEKQNTFMNMDKNSKDICWEELDQGEDMISVGDIS